MLRPLATGSVRAISLASCGASIIGRGSHGHLVDPRLSRQHLRLTSTADDGLIAFRLEALGSNPLQVQRNGGAMQTIRRDDTPLTITPGDTLYLLPGLHAHRLEVRIQPHPSAHHVRSHQRVVLQSLSSGSCPPSGLGFGHYSGLGGRDSQSCG